MTGLLNNARQLSRPFSMAEAGDPPDGSWVRVVETDDGSTHLESGASLSFPGRWALVLFLSGVLVGASLCGVIFFTIHLLQQPGWVAAIYDLFSLAAFVAGGCVVGRILWGLLHGEKPEAVTLGESELHFNPGGLDRYAGLTEKAFDLRRFWRRPPVRTFPRTAVQVSLRRFDGRQALLVQAGGERIEVGRFIREPEREWLAAVLRAWTGEDAASESQVVPDGPFTSEQTGELTVALEFHREGWESVRVVLRSLEKDRERGKLILIFGSFLCAWTVFGVGAMLILFQGLDLLASLFLTAWIAGWLAGIYFVGRAVVALLRSRESLVLTNDTLDHDIGCYQYFYEIHDESLWKLGRPRRVSVPRRAISGLRLESIGPRERLTFDLGADRIEVGRWLTNVDRRVLARILEEYVEHGLETVLRGDL